MVIYVMASRRRYFSYSFKMMNYNDYMVTAKKFCD